MGSIIVKPERDKDFYMIWSSIVDEPTGWGSRKFLLSEEGHLSDGLRREELFDRADERSSSSYLFPETWDEDWSLNFAQAGTIPRSRMFKLAEVLSKVGYDEVWYEHADVLALLDPFEDE